MQTIKFILSERDFDRFKRLYKMNLSDVEIFRAGLKTWEDRKGLLPLEKEK